MAQLPKSLFLLVLLLSSCSITHQLEDTYEQRFSQYDVVSIQDLQSATLKNVPIPQVSPVVAVYPTAFTDQTGQRKSNSEFALFSTAITQQPNALLIRALKSQNPESSSLDKSKTAAGSCSSCSFRKISLIFLDLLLKDLLDHPLM